MVDEGEQGNGSGGAGRFHDKVAIVTGAGSGIGRELSRLLAGEGARVLGVDINAAGLDETAERFPEAVVPHVADLTDPQACRIAVEACVAQMDRLDLLANVAGFAASAHFAEMPLELYRKIMSVNVDATFFMCQAAVPHLLRSAGNIVNVASNAGLMGQAYTVAYSTAKGAVIQLTRSLAMEYVKQGIRVNAVAPGGVDTPMSRNFSIPDGVDVDLMAPYMGFRAMAHPREVAELIAFVASERTGRSIHGSILSIDNGLTAG